MATPSPDTITLTVTHRGTAYSLTLPTDSTVAGLHSRLEDVTAVPTSLQKLLYKGRKKTSEDATLPQAGLHDGVRVQMLGPTTAELDGMRATEDETKRRDNILQKRAAKGPTKVRSTATPSSSYTFHTLTPLAHLPDPAAAHALLARLASDPAIRHVMRTHEFAVGVLTELAPHEHPGLLGLNVNAGQAIKLRLRTDAYDGFRLYADVRRVLCHELAHNVWSDHDDNFKALNSQLNKEVVEFERDARAGTHSLGGGGAVYEPEPALEAEAHAHILGGASPGASRPVVDSREERRRRVLEATMNRLRKEEEELEQSCGTAGPQASAME